MGENVRYFTPKIRVFPCSGEVVENNEVEGISKMTVLQSMKLLSSFYSFGRAFGDQDEFSYDESSVCRLNFYIRYTVTYQNFEYAFIFHSKCHALHCYIGNFQVLHDYSSFVFSSSLLMYYTRNL